MYIDDNFINTASQPMVPGKGQATSVPVMGGVMYTFKKKGEVVPMHTHAPTVHHLTFLMEGSVRHQQEGQDDVVYIAPAILVAPENVSHGFTSEIANTVVVNIAIRRLAEAG